uniref:Uncharacterized protein n=1 Tax=Salarias fasciatus TaxID=181472 RepID=A0A672H1K8_SALFA
MDYLTTILLCQERGLVPQDRDLSAHQRDLLKKGIGSYCLSEQSSLELGGVTALPPAFEKHVSPEILKVCSVSHIRVERSMRLYSIVCEGVTECSNTLEDEEDGEMLPQALVYKPCRQRIYGLLLLLGQDECPAVKEWFVSPGNPLIEPEMVLPVPVCDHPSLDLLWLSSGPEVSALRLTAFLSLFDCIELFSLYGAVQDSLLAVLCLVTYILLQVITLSQEDVDAYLSRAVCLKTSQELQDFAFLSQLPLLCSRALQLGSLYVRGLSHLLGANSASGQPLPSAALMPWQSFDGRLFHPKYLLAHSGTEKLQRKSFCWTAIPRAPPPSLQTTHQ